MITGTASDRALLKNARPWLLALACFLLVLWLQSLSADRQRAKIEPDSDATLLFGKYFPAFGYDNLLADFVWMRFAQYYGDQRSRQMSGYKLSYEYLDVITDRDPKFEKAYLAANFSVANKMGRTDLAEKLLTKGVRNNPDSYLIWQYRGFLHLLYTGAPDKAAFSFKQNAIIAVAREGNAKQAWGNYWWQMGSYLESNQPSVWQLRTIWNEVFNSAPDGETKILALGQLKKLGVVLDEDRKLHELYPAYPPKGFQNMFLFGPPSIKPQKQLK